MTAPAPRGTFVTFEGGEGSGKSTQARLLAEVLRNDFAEVVVTREPGGTPRAEALRDAILAGAARRYGVFAEAALFAAGRADHVAAVIAPALSRGAAVVCDRFVDSTRVYQGRVGGLSDEVLDGLDALSCGEIAPDLTLLLDVDPRLGLARAAARRGAGQLDRYEGEGLAFHARVREGFLDLARANPHRIAVIDAGREPPAVAGDVLAAYSGRVGEGRT